MKAFISNKLSELSSALYEELFDRQAAVLESRTVIVPSEEIKLDLYTKWLRKLDVITGIQTWTYKELVRKAFPEIPSKEELSLRLVVALSQVEELPPFLRDGSGGKRLDFCDELSGVFLGYLQRPREEILKWLENNHLQQQLWKRVFGEKHLPSDHGQPLDGPFFFYHAASITPYEWKLFSQMECYFFLFSPSEMYWGDFQTEKKQLDLLSHAKAGIRDELLRFFQEHSSLLSNWGVQGRALLKLFEDQETIERFQMPQGVSTLHQLQIEWMTLEKQSSPSDDSIELHSAPHALREVEVVWDIIHRLPHEPREIIVLAPDIALYAPMIEWVFEMRQNSYEYAITGVDAKSISPLLQCVGHLLALPKHRFSKEAFEKLLFCEPFLRRFNLSFEEARTILHWMEKVHLRCDLKGHSCSWQAALKRAVASFATSEEVIALEFSDAPILSRWIEIGVKIEQELLPLSDVEPRTALEWAACIERLVETFFHLEETDTVLTSILSSLKHPRVEGVFDFSTIERFLHKSFEKPLGSIHGSHRQSVQFRPLTQGAIQEAKAIILMGMHEGEFPRQGPASALATLPLSKQSEKDQSLFLETLCHAEEKLIFTYSKYHPEDGKEVRPSSLITQLIADRGEIKTVHHSAHNLGNFEKKKKHLPLPTSTPPKLDTIDIKRLKKLARHPIQCFLEHSLGIRFEKKESQTEFLLSPLSMYKVRKACLKMPLDQLIEKLEHEGELPLGSFKNLAISAIDAEVTSYKKSLEELGVDPASIFSLSFSPFCHRKCKVSPHHFVYPPLGLKLPSGKTCFLQGTIDDISPQGLLHHGEDSLEDALKIWPIYCTVFALLGKDHSSFLLTKNGAVSQFTTQDPMNALERYLEYYHKNLLAPSPLLPAWGRQIFKKGEIPSSLEDETLLWAEQRGILPARAAWVAEWKPYLQTAFHELI